MYEKSGFFIGGPGPLIGARERSWMKPSAIEVNTDRGGIADEAALGEVLLSRRLSGAGLDVSDMEPPLADKFAVAQRTQGTKSLFSSVDGRGCHSKVGRCGDEHHGLLFGQARSTALINISRSDYR